MSVALEHMCIRRMVKLCLPARLAASRMVAKKLVDIAIEYVEVRRENSWRLIREVELKN